MSEIMSLAKAYERYFKIGAATSPRGIVQHRDVLMRHFNSLTCENQMKYEAVEPEEGKFTFEEADKVLDFAKEMGIKVRAHAPVWHNATPDWIYMDGDKPAAPELIYERIDAHTKAIAEHFNDAVYCWDVVNEAARDDMDGNLMVSEKTQVYRYSKYYELCGEEFMVRAFKSMEKYSPDTQLFYNDYNEINPIKRDRIVKMIRTLREKGCRVDGFGMQQHYFRAPDYDELKRSIEIYAGLDLRLHITELDISMLAIADLENGPVKPGEPGYREYALKAMGSSPENLEKINKVYENLFEIYRSYSDVIDCVTTWGVADDMTWLDHFVSHPELDLPFLKQHPLLFDENHNPKPCVYNMIEAVK